MLQLPTYLEHLTKALSIRNYYSFSLWFSATLPVCSGDATAVRQYNDILPEATER